MPPSAIFQIVWYRLLKGLPLVFAMLSKALCHFFVNQVPGLEEHKVS